MRSTGRLLAAVGVILAATGCVSIPESSSVHAGRALSAQDERPLSSNAPDGPHPGAGRKEIATGYLSAMLAFPPAPDVVRQFLTPEAAANWNPDDGLVVYTESDQPRLSEKADSVVFHAKSLGSLDQRGTWSTARRGEGAIESDFTMSRVNGEWRLDNPLRGTFVDDDYFATYYDSFSLYYFDPAKSILVPDPVHMLLGESLATSLVKDLLLGPTRDIAGAVSSSVPSTARLDVSVAISPTGVAEVPLTDEILRLSSDDRRYFAAQLAWTLRPLQEINTIVVTVNGSRVDLGAGEEISVDDFSGFDPAGLAATRQLYALSSQGLVTVSDTDTAVVQGPLAERARTARSAAVDANASEAAVVSADGSTVTVAGMQTTDSGSEAWYRGGVDVMKPSWDIHGLLWIADNRSDGAHLLVANDSRAKEIDAPGITGHQVRSIAVSRDGVRLAAVVGDRNHSRLVIAVIDRDAQETGEVRVRAAHRVVTAGLTARQLESASWISPTSIAALADEDGGRLEPSEFGIDGWLVRPFSGFLPIRPTTLAASPNADTPAAIGDGEGSLYVQTPDAQWVQLGGTARLRAPFYSG
jgi:hypothetical protein